MHPTAQPHRVFVSALDPCTTQQSLHAYFYSLLAAAHPFGGAALLDVLVPRPRSSHCYAFVAFSDALAVALATSRAHVIDGRAVTVEAAEPRVARRAAPPLAPPAAAAFAPEYWPSSHLLRTLPPCALLPCAPLSCAPLPCVPLPCAPPLPHAITALVSALPPLQRTQLLVHLLQPLCASFAQISREGGPGGGG